MISVKDDGDFVTRMSDIRDTIENMAKNNQIEILKIVTRDNSSIVNENKNGIHINLTEMAPSIIKEIETYIKYIVTQENTLNEDEIEKDNYKNTYYMQKDNKDNKHNSITRT